MRLIKVEIAMIAVSALIGLGCSGGGEGAAAGGASEVGTATAAPELELGELDEQLAAQGEELFQSKGCTACHRIGGGRLVGPDLAGISERRSPEFIIAMIVNPDSMLVHNADAKQMLAEYFTPMANQNVTREDARALLEYFRSKDSEDESQPSNRE